MQSSSSFNKYYQLTLKELQTYVNSMIYTILKQSTKNETTSAQTQAAAICNASNQLNAIQEIVDWLWGAHRKSYSFF